MEEDEPGRSSSQSGKSSRSSGKGAASSALTSPLCLGTLGNRSGVEDEDDWLSEASLSGRRDDGDTEGGDALPSAPPAAVNGALTAMLLDICDADGDGAIEAEAEGLERGSEGS